MNICKRIYSLRSCVLSRVLSVAIAFSLLLVIAFALSRVSVSVSVFVSVSVSVSLSLSLSLSVSVSYTLSLLCGTVYVCLSGCNTEGDPVWEAANIMVRFFDAQYNAVSI